MVRPEPRHLILVGYDAARTARALRLCERAFSGLSMERRLLVANSDEALMVKLPPGWTAVRGTNSLGEFSGWQEGLELLGTAGKASVLLINDTVGGYRHLSIFRRWALRHEIVRNDGKNWIGFVDRHVDTDELLLIGDRDCSEWASTYCFYIPRSTLSNLGGRIYDPAEVDRLVPGGSDPDHFFSRMLSKDLRDFLRHWLFGGGWIRSVPLDDASAGPLAFKAKCICAEMLLSSNIRRLGIALRDPMRLHRWVSHLEHANGRARSRLRNMRTAAVRL